MKEQWFPPVKKNREPRRRFQAGEVEKFYSFLKNTTASNAMFSEEFPENLFAKGYSNAFNTILKEFEKSFLVKLIK